MRKPTHPDNADLTGLIRGNWLVLGPVEGSHGDRWTCQCLVCQAETRVYPRERLTGHGGRLHGCANTAPIKPARNPRNVDLSGNALTWADLGDPCV